MKNNNITQGRAHHEAIQRGWVAGDRAGSTGINVEDGTTDATGITRILVIGGTVTDSGNGTVIITIGSSGGVPETGDASSLLGIPIRVWSGPTSAPPTEPELEAILGSPVDSAGLTFIVLSTTSGYYYTVESAGTFYKFTPLTTPTGISGDGGGSTGPAVVALTSAPHGGWSWFQDPRAIAHGTYTYVGYNEGGTLKVAAINGGAVVNTVTVHTALEYDDHDTPTLYVDPINDKLICFYSAHLGPTIYMRISNSTLTSNPSLSGGFATEQSLGATFETNPTDRYLTYPSPLYTNNSDGGGEDKLWVFYRVHPSGGDAADWHYQSSIDGGTTWQGTSDLHTLTYQKAESDGVSAIHVACSEGPGAIYGDQGKIWHLYRESAHWHKSDGTNIVGSQPYGPSDLTTVYDGSGASDEVWISDIALTSGGDPVIAFVKFPGGDETDHRAMYAAWNGASWDVHQICVMGDPGSISGEYPPGSPNDTYHAGLVLDHDDPQIVYVGRWISGQVEMFQYVTANGGTSFTSTQLTTSSASKNIRPVGVRNADDISVVWLYGTYTNYTNYTLGIRGYQVT